MALDHYKNVKIYFFQIHLHNDTIFQIKRKPSNASLSQSSKFETKAPEKEFQKSQNKKLEYRRKND
jgi:hypothetical protein